MPDLFTQPVIGIDLGASYTKISFRTDWSNGHQNGEARRFVYPSKLIILDGDPLIPSLVIFTKKKGWIFGKEAADYVPRRDDQVFQNWKSVIFSKGSPRQVAGANDAAGSFFKWLKGKLDELQIPVEKCRIKICLPAFDDISEPAEILADKMYRNGWQNVSVSKIQEPRANTVGIFTEGRNNLWRRYPQEDPNPVFQEIYPGDSPILRHFYNSVMIGTNPTLTIGVVDLGSFTTDISLVTVDTRGDGDCIDQGIQKSYDLGVIKGYEKPLFEKLANNRDFAPEDLSFSQCESIKSAIAAGKELRLPLPSGRTEIFGTQEDIRISNSVAEKLADEVFQTLTAMINNSPVAIALFTGGGIAIEEVRKRLHSKCQAVGIYPYEPRGESDNVEVNTAEVVTRQSKNKDLQRIATAIGSTSVLLDLPVSERIPDVPNSPQAANFTVCSCHGGNKLCMRCGGLGHYKTS
jgi:hypothetical protein